MRDGWTGNDPYPEDGYGPPEPDQFRKDLPAMIQVAKDINDGKPRPARLPDAILIKAFAAVIAFFADGNTL